MPTSPKKSTPVAQRKKGKSKENGGFGGFETTIETPADQQIAALQDDLASEKDARLEERFMWIFISSFFCICALSQIIPAPAWCFIAPLYLGFLIIAAKRCGVDDVVVILNKISSKYFDNKDESEKLDG